MENPQNLFTVHFGLLKDPRINRKKKHELLDIIAITVLAVISGANGWTDVARFGKAKETWLRTFLTLPNGIPSHDTFGRVFSLLCPKAFEACFRGWVHALQERVEGVVALYGKTVRRSHDAARGKEAIHIVSAWASDHGLALGQIKIDAKSNEITAIPELLNVLEITGCLVTIDAMGCQREIAQKVLDKQADYLLVVKDNQETLREDVEQEFKQALADGFAHMEHQYLETIEKNHGRIEKRQYWYTHDVGGLGTLDRWPGLAGMVMCQATRTVKGLTSTETRYFITSATHNDVQKIATGVRNHWGIENSLHWVLDIAFDEDQCRIRSGYAAENFATVRKMAINVIKRDKTKDGGVKAKRLQAAWDTEYLCHLLTQV